MAFFDRELKKTYLFSTNGSFCHKDVESLIETSMMKGPRAKKITSYDD